MRDYGFTTYDENGKKIDGFVNSKYPIFGPRYNNIKNCFKTIHISDTTSHTLDQIPHQEPPMPSGNEDIGDVVNSTHGFVKEKIFEFEHGMGFRPLGYVYFSGNVVRTTTMMVIQDESAGIAYDYGYFGGDFNITGYDIYRTIARPDIKDQIADTSVGLGGASSPLFSFCAGIEGYVGTSYGFEPTVRVNNRVPSRFAGSIGQGGTPKFYEVINKGAYGEPTVPYTAEIDEKYIKIYRNICWADYKARMRRYSNEEIWFDVNQRIKLCTSYEGTELDATIYLCPYKMEDLL